MKRVDRTTAMSALAHTVIASALPPPQRRAFQRRTRTVQAGLVDPNDAIGLRVEY